MLSLPRLFASRVRLNSLFTSGQVMSRIAVSAIALGLGAITLFTSTPVDAFDGTRLSRAEQEKMAQETRLALNAVQRFHYKRKSFDEISAEELIESFMHELDYSRMYFIQSDYEELLLRFGPTLKRVYLARGQLYPAFEIFDLYKRRALARMDWAFERLQGEFDFTGDEIFYPDRSEMNFPATMEEADKLWEQRIHYELLAEILSDQDLDTAREKLHRRYERTKRFIEEIEIQNVQEIFLTSFTQLYDPHSTFFSADTAEQFTIDISNSLVGIGALLRDEDGICVIQELVAGGPAELSGQIHPGDQVIEVAQDGEAPVDVVDMKLSKVVKMIRGEKGSKVHLTIVPAEATDSSERKIVTLVRDEIKLTANLAEGEIFNIDVPNEGRTAPVGVIELPSFYGNGFGDETVPSTTEDVAELIEKMKERNVEGIVLDLRRNGGGLLTEAIDLAGLFIPTGPVVMVRDFGGDVEEKLDEDPGVLWEGPLVVLTSRRSASASEIVAGALQAHNRAIVVGDTNTHGKGTVQATMDLTREAPRLGPLGMVKLTIQKFYLPNGSSTQKEGVHADIALPSINDFLPIGESDLPNALLWDSIQPQSMKSGKTFLTDDLIVSNALRETLAFRSEARRETLPEFDYLRRYMDWFEERQEEEGVSLNLETRQARKDADEALRDELEIERDELSLSNPPSETIKLSLSQEMDAEHQAKLIETPLPNGLPRANNYYQTIFYYQENPEDEIHEVFIEFFDYAEFAEEADEIAAKLSKVSGQEIPAEAMEAILKDFRQIERSRDLNSPAIFATHLGDSLNEEQIEALLPLFFRTLVEQDKRILATSPLLDIPLRESLRVMGDWLELQDHPDPKATIAKKQDPAEKTESPQPGILPNR